MNIIPVWVVAIPLVVGCDPKPGGTGESTAGTGETSTSTGSTSTGEPTSSSGTTTSTGDPTTSTTTTTGEPTTSTTDSPFVEDPDMGPQPNACDYHLEGCSPDQKCNVYAPQGESNVLGNLGCFPLDPNPKQIGEPCSTGELPNDGIDNCVAGAVCWNVDDNGNGTCHGLCYPEPGTEDFMCHGQAASCSLCQECAVGLCLPFCDPLQPDCGDGLICVAHYDGFVCAPDASNGEAGDGVACEFINACNAGLMCGDGSRQEGCETNGCCTPYCDMNNPDACPEPSEMCAAVYEQPPEGYEHIGACLQPE